MGVIVNLMIGITIALLPLYSKFSGVDMARTSKDNLLLILMVFMLFLLPKTSRVLPLSIFMGLIYGLFNLVINQWSPESFLVIMQTFYAATGMIFFAAYYERHVEWGKELILDGMAIGCLIQSFVVILSCLGFNPYVHLVLSMLEGHTYIKQASGYAGTLGNPNILSAYIGMTGLALLRSGWWWFIPLPVITLVISGGEMGVLTLLSGLLYFINFKFKIIHKVWVYGIASFGMLSIFLVGAGGMDSQRFDAWKLLFKNVSIKHFFIGNGPGWFGDKGIILNANEIMRQEHNSFITAFNFFGILIFAFLAPVVWKFLKRKDLSAVFPSVLFAAFCNSFGNFSLHQSTNALIIIVTAAICLAEGNEYV